MIELGEALVKKGVEVHVITAKLKGTSDFEVIRGIKVHRIKSTIVKIPGFFPPPLVVCPNFVSQLAKLDQQENFDLFHLHDRWFPDFTRVRDYSKKTGTPYVLTIHNARPNGISPVYTVVGSAYEAAVGKRALRDAAGLIAVSEWTKRDMMKYNLPADKFDVIYNGLDATTFKTTHNPQVKQRLGMKPTDPLLTWVGRIIEQKGLKYLLQAIPAVLKEHPGAKLMLIGTGTQVKELKKLANKLGISKSIIFNGPVYERSKLNDLLRGADAFVFPSVWEPFGIAIIEAMASGLPVVAARTGGIPEIVTPGKTGYLAPMRNSRELAIEINKLLADEKKRAQMGCEARKVVENNFNWNRIANQTIAFYKTHSQRNTRRPKYEALIKIREQIAAKLHLD